LVSYRLSYRSKRGERLETFAAAAISLDLDKKPVGSSARRSVSISIAHRQSSVKNTISVLQRPSTQRGLLF
jgi:hypothetical protein